MISCPKCHNNIFQVAKDMCQKAQVSFDNDNMIVTPVEGTTKQSILKCVSCGAAYNLEDEQVVNELKNPPVQCSKCGKMYSAIEVENGVCALCRAKEIDANFAKFEQLNAEQLLRMLATVRIENYKLTNEHKVEEQIEKADEQKEEKPKKRKRRTKAEIEAEKKEDLVDVDAEQQEDSDIEISEDTAPELPESVTEMSNAMEEG